MTFKPRNFLAPAIMLLTATMLLRAQASTLLETAEPNEIILVLKCFRSPDYAALAPAFLPLLQNANAGVLRDDCRTLAVMGNTNVIPAIEPLLNDWHPAVRKDAQDAIALLNGSLSGKKPGWAEPGDRSLSAHEPKEIVKLLKLVRSPDYVAMVPGFLPLLQHNSANVIRDACRTLAVMGDKKAIPAIEPLLNDKRENVRKDAQDALAALRAKP